MSVSTASLLRFLVGHEVTTVRRAGMLSLANGELLKNAQRNYDVLLTVDKNLHYQNAISRFEIGVLLIRGRKTTLDALLKRIDQILAALKDVKPGQFVELNEQE